MENSKMLTAESFNGRLNFECFTNLEKAMDSVDFKHKYVASGNYEVFDEKAINKFLKDSTDKVKEISNTNLQKAEGEDKEDIDILVKGITEQINSTQAIRVRADNGDIHKYFVRLKKKADTVEKADKNDLEKGVLDGISYSAENSFLKPGVQVKEKITTIKNNMVTKQTNLKVKMEALEEKIGFKPTQELDQWTRKRCVDEKKLENLLIYPWDCCYFNEHYKSNSVVTDGEQKRVATTKEEATLCHSYNRAIEDYCEAACDEEKAEVFLRNMDEKKTYKLSLSELTQLGF